MACKYSKDLDEALVKKVKEAAQKADLQNQITVEAVRLKRAKNNIGEVVKGNDVAQLYAGDDNIVVIALYEEAFDLVDDETKDLWIEGLIAQVSYDWEKDKLSINKPEIQLSEGMYTKYGQKALDIARLAVQTLSQIKEQQEEEKAMKKALKIKNKK